MLLEQIKINFETKKNELCYLSKTTSYTYEELEKMVKQIYVHLKKENVTGRVLCVGHKEIEMIAAFLACSYAGITYIPIDESMPKERLEYIINDTNPSLVLRKKDITEMLNTVDAEIVLDINMKKEDVYYIIYTSGSTGNPKGVEVTYSNLESFVKWFVEVISKENVRVLNQAMFSFDLSVADLYFSLYTASTLCITETSFMKDANMLYEELKLLDVDVTVMTPSYANLLLTDKKFNKELLPKLDTMYFCGEILTKKTVDKLKDRFGDVRIINSYGPTECTVAIASIDVNRNLDSILPVGGVKEGTEVYILDDNLEEINGSGEIIISGESVAKGYLNLESDRFFWYKDKWSYRTGDVGCVRDGILYFETRKDDQIKYLGYRIELEDITTNILDVDEVENVVTFAKKNEENVVKKIISCVKLKEGRKISSEELTRVLKEKLPSYMIPKIKFVDEVMLNANGKIDKKQMEEKYIER